MVSFFLFLYYFLILPKDLRDHWGLLHQNFRKNAWWARKERFFSILKLLLWGAAVLKGMFSGLR